jgi:hypothetical protein
LNGELSVHRKKALPIRSGSAVKACIGPLIVFLRLLFAALLLCGQFPLAMFSLNQNVIRVF